MIYNMLFVAIAISASRDKFEKSLSNIARGIRDHKLVELQILYRKDTKAQRKRNSII